MVIFAKQVIAAFVLMYGTGAMAKDDLSASTIVASVNGTNITLGHMILVRESLPAQYQSASDEQLFQNILEQIIRQTLLAQFNKQPETLRTKLTLENDRRSLRAAEAVDAISSEPIDEDAIKETYKLNYLNAAPTKEYNVSHILVETEEKAVRLLKMLKDGMEFEELAINFSIGPSKQNSGKLGRFRHGMMVPSCEEAVISLKKGEISKPVKTDFGWHVIKLNNMRNLTTPPLEEVRAEIFSKLQQQFVAEQIKKFRNDSLIIFQNIEHLDTTVLRNTNFTDGR